MIGGRPYTRPPRSEIRLRQACRSYRPQNGTAVAETSAWKPTAPVTGATAHSTAPLSSRAVAQDDRTWFRSVGVRRTEHNALGAHWSLNRLRSVYDGHRAPGKTTTSKMSVRRP